VWYRIVAVQVHDPECFIAETGDKVPAMSAIFVQLSSKVWSTGLASGSDASASMAF
jgi:hypothetical protein